MSMILPRQLKKIFLRPVSSYQRKKVKAKTMEGPTELVYDNNRAFVSTIPRIMKDIRVQGTH